MAPRGTGAERQQLAPDLWVQEPRPPPAGEGAVRSWAGAQHGSCRHRTCGHLGGGGRSGGGRRGREVMAGLMRASSVSLTLLQTKCLWGEGRRLPQGSGRRVRGVCAAVSLCGAVPLMGQWAEESWMAGLAQGLRKLFFCFGFPCTLAGDSKSKRCPESARSPCSERSPGAEQTPLPPLPGRRGAEGSRARRDSLRLRLCAAPVSWHVPGHLDPRRRGRDRTGPRLYSGLSMGWLGPGRMRLSRHQAA